MLILVVAVVVAAAAFAMNIAATGAASSGGSNTRISSDCCHQQLRWFSAVAQLRLHVVVVDGFHCSLCGGHSARRCRLLPSAVAVAMPRDRSRSSKHTKLFSLLG